MKEKDLKLKKQYLNSQVFNLDYHKKQKLLQNHVLIHLFLQNQKFMEFLKNLFIFTKLLVLILLVDIVGITIALEDLKLFDEKIICLPVSVGGGSVTFSHGTMSNPASAILEIFKNSNLIIKGNDANEELTTPTGACILVNLVHESVKYYPSMKVDSIGYGAGQKDFETFSNVLKIVRGSENNFEIDSVKILETNVDDVSGEILGNLIEKIMKKGARDVSIYPGITKKEDLQILYL